MRCEFQIHAIISENDLERNQRDVLRVLYDVSIIHTKNTRALALTIAVTTITMAMETAVTSKIIHARTDLNLRQSHNCCAVNKLPYLSKNKKFPSSHTSSQRLSLHF